MKLPRWRLHWIVDPMTGLSLCGAGHPPAVAIPALTILGVTCRRCMAMEDFSWCFQEEKRRVELRQSYIHSHFSTEGVIPVGVPHG